MIPVVEIENRVTTPNHNKAWNIVWRQRLIVKTIVNSFHIEKA